MSKMKLANFEIEAEDWKNLQHIALDKETSVTKILRELVKEYIKKNGKKS